MAESRKHVLLWVAAEFLQSEGITQILKEAGLFPAPDEKLDELFQSAEEIAGFALTGKLVDAHHMAGIWISPLDKPEIEMMIPWGAVRTVVTADEPKRQAIVGLASTLAAQKAVEIKLAAQGKKTTEAPVKQAARGPEGI